VLRVGGIVSLAIAALLIGYSFYAAWIGEVIVATRSGDVAVRLAATPQYFFLGIAFYGAGAALFVWIGRGLICKSRRGRSLC